MKFKTLRPIFLFLSFFGCFVVGYWFGHKDGEKYGTDKQQKQEELNKLRRLDDEYKYNGQGKCAGC